MMLRNKTKLLSAIAQTYASPTARTQREHRLIGLIAHVALGLVRIKPCENAIEANWIQGDSDGLSGYSGENRRQEKSQVRASHQQHCGADAHQENRRAII